MNSDGQGCESLVYVCAIRGILTISLQSLYVLHLPVPDMHISQQTNPKEEYLLYCPSTPPLCIPDSLIEVPKSLCSRVS